MNAIDDAEMLLLMAAKDIKAMKSLLDPDSADDEIFGFYAQQATEKALKAWIVLSGGTYGRTHSLVRLFAMLEDLGIDVKRFTELEELAPFAVELRYEAWETPEPSLDRASILSQVSLLYSHVKTSLETAQAKLN